MAIAAIDEWLRDPERSYSDGVSLYETHGKSKFLKNLFASSEDDFNLERLYQELKKIQDAAIDSGSAGDKALTEESKVDQELESFKRFTTVQVPAIDTSKLPHELQVLAAEKGQLYRQAVALHSRLALMQSDDDRKKAAERIVHLFYRIDEIWSELDFFNEYGTIKPKGEDLTKLSTIALLKRRNNCRSNLSRHKQDPDGKKYKHYMLLLEAIERILETREEDDA